MEHHAAAGWPTEVMAPVSCPRAQDVPFDPFAINGANHWYDVGAHKVRAISNDLANQTFRPGWLRSVGPGFTNWALESFIDEAAAQAEGIRVAFRLDAHREGAQCGLGPNSHWAARCARRQVVQRVGAEGRLGRRLPDRHRPWPRHLLRPGTRHADLGRLRRARQCRPRQRRGEGREADARRRRRNHRRSRRRAGADGRRVALGSQLALHEGTEFENGHVKDTNLDSYTPLRMADVPELDISFIDSTEVPVGLGEPATTVVGPAIGNAIFDAVGVRLRDLPIRSNALLQSLTQKS